MNEPSGESGCRWHNIGNGHNAVSWRIAFADFQEDPVCFIDHEGVSGGDSQVKGIDPDSKRMGR